MCINDPLVATEAFSTFQPDLVLLDINMPEKNGFCCVKGNQKDQSFCAHIFSFCL